MELGGGYRLDIASLNIESSNLYEYLSDYNSLFFDSGRSARKFVLRQLSRDGKVLLPEYICRSVIQCFDNEKIVFYKIKDDYIIDIDDMMEKIKNDISYI